MSGSAWEISSLRESTASWGQQGALFSASGPGDWILNMGGSGTTQQSVPNPSSLPGLLGVPSLPGDSSSLIPWLLIAGGIWLLMKKR